MIRPNDCSPEAYKQESLNDEIVQTARELVSFILEKHGIKSLDQFTCPITKRLAGLVEQYEREEQ